MTNPLEPNISRKRSLRTKLAVAAMGAASFAGAVALVPAAASAQDATPAETQQVDLLLQEVPGSDQSENEDRRSGRRGHRGDRGDRGDRGAAIAELLGLETDELREARQSGSTLAEIAEANGVDREALVDAIVAAKTEKINDRVAAGDVDAADAQDRLDGLEDRVSERIDRIKGDRGNRNDRGATEGASA